MPPSAVLARLTFLDDRIRRAAARLEAEAAARTLGPDWAAGPDDVRSGLAAKLRVLERNRRVIAGEWFVDGRETERTERPAQTQVLTPHPVAARFR